MQQNIKKIFATDTIKPKIEFFVTKHDKKLYVFICELKSKRRAKGSKNQIEAGYILAQFLTNTAIRMLNFRKIETEYRALIFTPKGTRNRTCKVKKKLNMTNIPNQI